MFIVLYLNTLYLKTFSGCFFGFLLLSLVLVSVKINTEVWGRGRGWGPGGKVVWSVVCVVYVCLLGKGESDIRTKGRGFFVLFCCLVKADEEVAPRENRLLN